MKIVYAGDFHLGIPQRYSEQRDDIINSINVVIEYCLENKVTHFINLGDTFNSSTRVRNEDLFFIKDSLNKLAKENIKVYNLVGNHDYHSSNDLISLFSLEDNIYSVNKYNYPVYIRDIDTVLYPYLLKNSELIIEPKNLKEITTGCFHQEINGWFDFNLDENNINSAIINEEMITNLQLNTIISGHIHKHVEYNVGDTSIVYVSSTSITSFSDFEDEHGFLVTEDNKSFEYISIPQRKWLSLNYIPEDIYNGAVYRLSIEDDQIDLSSLKNYFEDNDAFLISVVIEKESEDKTRDNNTFSSVDSTDFRSSLFKWFNYDSINASEMKEETKENIIDKHVNIVENIK